MCVIQSVSTSSALVLLPVGKVPDWRFGQLMSNILGEYVAEKKRDIFFPDDDEMIEFFEDYFKPKD